MRLEDMVRGAEILVLSSTTTHVVAELVHARALAGRRAHPRGRAGGGGDGGVQRRRRIGGGR